MASQAPAGRTSPPDAPSPAIETDHLRREYGEVVAVNGLGLLTVLVLVAARLYPGLAR